MKANSLFLILLLSSLFFSAKSQSTADKRQGDKELLDAIEVFSKYSGSILLQDSIIKNDLDKISSIYFIIASSPEGYGYRNSIQSKAIFDKNAQINFCDVTFEKEKFFTMSGTWNYVGNPGLRSFSFVDGYGIVYNDQVKIINLKSGFGKVETGKYEQRKVDVIYGENGADMSFNEMKVFAKGKELKSVKETGTLPMGNRKYKEYTKDGMKYFDFDKVTLSTYKGKEGKVESETHYSYCIAKNMFVNNINKFEKNANGSIKNRTTYYYSNNSIIGSASFNNSNQKTDSTYYEYKNQQGFVTLKASFKLVSDKLIPDTRREYSYEPLQKDGESINVEGKYNFKQIVISTIYDSNGNPRYQESSEHTKRRYYENGTWSDWRQLQY